MATTLPRSVLSLVATVFVLLPYSVGAGSGVNIGDSSKPCEAAAKAASAAAAGAGGGIRGDVFWAWSEKNGGMYVVQRHRDTPKQANAGVGWVVPGAHLPRVGARPRVCLHNTSGPEPLLAVKRSGWGFATRALVSFSRPTNSFEFLVHVEGSGGRLARGLWKPSRQRRFLADFVANVFRRGARVAGDASFCEGDKIQSRRQKLWIAGWREMTFQRKESSKRTFVKKYQYQLK